MFRSFLPELPIYPETSLLQMYNNLEIYESQINQTYKSSVNNIETQIKLILDRTI